jgi:hypothetical protein
MRKLTVKRLGMRQSHAISNIKMRKSLFDTFNSNRKQWSNMRGINNKVMFQRTKDGMLGGISNSIVLSKGIIAAPDSLNLFSSQFNSKDQSI